MGSFIEREQKMMEFCSKIKIGHSDNLMTLVQEWVTRASTSIDIKGFLTFFFRGSLTRNLGNKSQQMEIYLMRKNFEVDFLVIHSSIWERSFRLKPLFHLLTLRSICLSMTQHLVKMVTFLSISIVSIELIIHSVVLTKCFRCSWAKQSEYRVYQAPKSVYSFFQAT